MISDELKRDRAREAWERWQERHSDAVQQTIDAFKTSKASTVGCSNCKSRLSRPHMAENLTRLPRCPVCGNSLVGKPARERLVKLEAREVAALEILHGISVEEEEAA